MYLNFEDEFSSSRGYFLYHNLNFVTDNNHGVFEVRLQMKLSEPGSCSTVFHILKTIWNYRAYKSSKVYLWINLICENKNDEFIKENGEAYNVLNEVKLLS